MEHLRVQQNQTQLVGGEGDIQGGEEQLTDVSNL